MSKPPVLAFPDKTKQLFVHMNASKSASGAVLMQVRDNKRMTAVQYESCSLTKTKRSHSTFDREAAAVISALKTYDIIFRESSSSCIAMKQRYEQCLRRSTYMGD